MQSGIDSNCSCGSRCCFSAEADWSSLLDLMHFNWSGKCFCLYERLKKKSATEWFSQAQSAVSFHGFSFQLHHFFLPQYSFQRSWWYINILTYLDFGDSTYCTEFTFLFLLSNSRLIIRRKGYSGCGENNCSESNDPETPMIFEITGNKLV